MKAFNEKAEPINEGEVIFTKIAPDDWMRVRDLRVQSLRDNPKAFGQTPEEAMQTGEDEWRRRLENGEYLFATQNGELVGMVSRIFGKNQKERHIAHIYSVYVVPEMRGRGIGRKLMEKVISEIMNGHPEVIKLEVSVSVSQPEALALYESLGFERVALDKKEMKVGDEYIDEWYLVKFIRT